MPHVTHYDLAVIGTGSGNAILDDRFADWRVAVLEEHKFGGTCLNVGCIPTKMYVYPADLAELAGHGPDLGVLTSYDGAAWASLRDRVFDRIDGIEDSGRHYRQDAPNIDVYGAHATFVGDHTLDTGTGTQITADQIVIAAGSRVDVAPISGLEDVPYETSDTVLRLETLPRSMVVVGGGYVASELCHVFASLGTRVVQVQRGGRLLLHHDAEISEIFTRTAAARWDVRLDVTAEQVVRSGDTVTCRLSDGSEVAGEVLLVATGRVSNADRLGLEATSVKTDSGGEDDDVIVAVDDHQRTSVPGVWALGDVANRWQLKHVANAEARTVQHNLLHPDDLRSTEHHLVPSVVFTSPQIASVGLTSEAAEEAGVAHRSVTQDYADVAYGWAMESPRGDHLVKLVATPDGGRILGAHIIGPQASLLLQPLVQGMATGLSPARMSQGQYWPHPSLAEVVENALLKLLP
jgi:mycothione reductase